MAKKKVTKTETVNKKKGGRPKGSKTKLKAVAEVQKQQTLCPACQSINKPTVLGILSKQAYHMVIEEAKVTEIIRKRVQCNDCGKVYIERSYAFDAEKWQS